MRVGIARLMVICAAMIAFGAAPSMAQLATGRIDAVVADSTGAVLPGVTVDISGSADSDCGHRCDGRSPLPEPCARHLHRQREALRLQRLPQQKRQRRVPVRACRSRIALSVAGVVDPGQVTGETPVVDTKKMDDVDQRQRRGAAEHSVLARSVGRPADRSRRHRRPRERRRRRVRAAVELPGEGRQRRREHVEHGRHRHHRHGGARLDADLLRLRHVPGDAGHDGRRRRRRARRRACS